MKKTKIFAAYLPQYHETEDNNKFWGKGYTDWTAVKNAKPQFDNHKQPRIPLNNEYYDLSDIEVIRKQAQIAKKYGISGFNIYHYWFKNGKQELEKPAELLLSHPEIDIEYFFTWDSGSWKRTWSNVSGNDWAPTFDSVRNNNEPAILVEGGYEDIVAWKKHFQYLLRFFIDPRYLKIDNKPVLLFMDTGNQDILKQMEKCWNELAREKGFSGMYLASRRRLFLDKSPFNRSFLYQPEFSAWGKRRAIETRLTKYFGINFKTSLPVRYMYDYSRVWTRILKEESKHKKGVIPGCFVSYDDTPRRGEKAMVVTGASPNKFFEYFCKFYYMVCKNNRDFMLITAWNEWGEGAYLEPDEEYKEGYLEAVSKAVKDVNEKYKL